MSTSLSALPSLSAISTLAKNVVRIAPNDVWGNWMALCGNAALANWLSKRTAVFGLLGPPISALALTFLMATIGILPVGGTAAAAQLQHLTLHLSMPLVLLGADFRDAARRCGPLLLSFAAAAVATLVASALGWIVLGNWLSAVLPVHQDALKICAGIMARNVGGGLNYMAVCSVLQATPTAIAAGLCADNLFGLAYFPTVSYLAKGRVDPADEEEEEEKDEKEESEHGPSAKEQVETSSKKLDDSVSVDHVTTILFASVALVWLGHLLGGERAALPICTLLTVLLINKLAPPRWVRSIQPTAHVLGTSTLYVFFSTLGAQGAAVAESVRTSLLPLLLFLGLLYGIHGTWLWTLRKVLWRRPNNQNQNDTASSSSSFQKTVQASLNVPRLLTASSAAIGGPATALALAQAQDWKSLEVPGLLVGNLGDAIGTFLGIAFFMVFCK